MSFGLEAIRHLVRLTVGLAVLSLWFVLEGDMRWWAFVGILPIASIVAARRAPDGRRERYTAEGESKRAPARADALPGVRSGEVQPDAAMHALLTEGKLRLAAERVLSVLGDCHVGDDTGEALRKVMMRNDDTAVASRLTAHFLATGDDTAAKLAYRHCMSAAEGGVESEVYRIVGAPEDCFEVVPLPAEARELFLLREMSGKPRTTFPAILGRIDGGSVLGLSNIAANARRQVCLEGLIHNPARLSFKASDERDTIRFAVPGAIIAAHEGVDSYDEGVLIGNHENFGHWLLNHVGRLFLKESYRQLNDVPIVVGENVSRRQEELLARLGYGTANIVKLRRGRLARFDRLWLPGMLFCVRSADLGRGGGPGTIYWTPEVVHGLRRRLDIPACRVGRGAKLYLTRRGARWRLLLNEHLIQQFLVERGFEVVDPAELTIAEQIDIARNAETIVGAFGAGMNLLLFAPADAKIVELKYQVGIMDINPFLCRYIGQTYLQVLGVPRQEGGSVLNYDFTVSVERLAQVLGG